MKKTSGHAVHQPIDQTGLGLTSRLEEVRAKVMCCLDTSRLRSIPAQPPGSRPPSLRVATHGKRVASFVRLLRICWRKQRIYSQISPIRRGSKDIPSVIPFLFIPFLCINSFMVSDTKRTTWSSKQTSLISMHLCCKKSNP